LRPELGILLGEPRALDQALALIDDPERAQLFLMDEGVHAAEEPRLRALLDAGLDASLCAMDAEARGLAPRDGGVRFGAQHDHARMIRDAARVVTLTGAAQRDARPRPGARRVAVRISRLDKALPALRSAVGYLTADLAVTVVVDRAAGALLAHADHPPAILRALGTLRGLGCAVGTGSVEADLEVCW
jgi:hypothetical protein